MSDKGKLEFLEQNRMVPERADRSDWQLAPKASWWGKPLDPKEFWEGKVIWLSREARAQALAHGRGYPPIPLPYATLPLYQNQHDVVSDSGGFDSGDGIRTRYNYGESAFWNEFSMTNPIPPDDINFEQLLAASRTVNGQPAALADQKPDPDSEFIRNHPVRLGFPPEAFTPEALFWTYVMDKRSRYEQLESSDLPKKDVRIDMLLSDVKVDSQYITQPLSAEQIQAANAWKIAYLNRLQQQKTDSSYINAYLKAWNIPASALSAGTRK